MTIARRRYIADVTEALIRHEFGMCVGCGEDLTDDGRPFFQVQKWEPPTHEIGTVSGAHITYDGKWHGHANYCVSCWDSDRRRSIGPRRFWFYHRKFLTNPWDVLPYLGGDEYGRRTVSLRVWGGRLVIALGDYQAPSAVDKDTTTPSEGLRQELETDVPL